MEAEDEDDGEDGELVLEDDSDDNDREDSIGLLTQANATTAGSAGEPLAHSQLASATASSQRPPHRHRRRALSSDDEDSNDGHGATSVGSVSPTTGGGAADGAGRPGHRLGGESHIFSGKQGVSDQFTQEELRKRRLRALGHGRDETTASGAVATTTENCVHGDQAAAVHQTRAPSRLAVWIDQAENVDPRSLREFLNGRTLR